jgi:hypothetical protein
VPVPERFVSAPPPRWLARAALVLVLLGVAGRLLRYALCFPVWGDEAFIALSLIDRDYLGLTRQLECRQIAPLLFLWAQRAAVDQLGTSEYALRLVPLLAGLGALALFWSLARHTLSPLAATFATGLLAVSRWPITMSANVKPYSLDLLCAVALLLPAARYLARPDQRRWLLVLALLAPVLPLASYPAVFVGGAVALALLPVAWRGGWTARGLFALYAALLLAGFLTAYLLVGREQLDPEHGLVRRDMEDYWRHGFPPAEPLGMARWLLWAHTSWILAYPAGGDRGGSLLTALACAAGAWQLARGRRLGLLVLLLTPFALGIVAAVLRKYPYGAATRLAQHLAPAVCLLAGAGLAALVERVASATANRAALAACAVLAAFALGGMAADVAHPYRDDDALWARTLTRDLLAHAAPGDRFVVLDERAEVSPLFRWHLSALGPRLRWGGAWDHACPEGVWTIKVWIRDEPLPAPRRRAEVLAVAPAGWVVAGQRNYALPGHGIALHHDALAVRWARPAEKMQKIQNPCPVRPPNLD